MRVGRPTLLASSCSSLVVTWQPPEQSRRVVGYAVHVAESSRLSSPDEPCCDAAAWRRAEPPPQQAQQAHAGGAGASSAQRRGNSFELGGLEAGLDYAVAVVARTTDDGWGPPSDSLGARTMAAADFPRPIGAPSLASRSHRSFAPTNHQTLPIHHQNP